MSELTHRVKHLPPGTTPEKALGDCLANMVYTYKLLEEWRIAVSRDGSTPIHTGSTKTYGQMLEQIEKEMTEAIYQSRDVLYSVGRWMNPPL